MTSSPNQQLRDNITRFIDGLGLPEGVPDEDPERRPDGVLEFGKHWCVRGDMKQGVFASFSDRDDVIQFGLLERDGDVATNLLDVTVVLDDDGCEVHSVSESYSDFNFVARATPQRQGSLDDALRLFASGLRGVAA